MNDLMGFVVSVGPRGALRLECLPCNAVVQSGGSRRGLLALLSAARSHKCKADDSSTMDSLLDMVQG